MNILKKLLMISSIVFSTSLFAATPSVAPTINFAMEATYPPFEYMDANGQIQGFDVAIAKALCKEMNATCTFTNQPFASLIPSLNLGKFDAIISAMGITAERQQEVAFSKPYYQPSATFVAATGNHYSLNDVPGKIVGTQIGTTMAQYLQEKYNNTITLKTYGSIQDAYLDLTSGRVDLVLADTPIAMNWLKQNSNAASYSIVGAPIVNSTYFGAGYGIAVRKDDPALLADLNQALAKIKANGTYAAIKKEYLSSSP